MQITNTADISLPMAVWLLADSYDYINMPNYISATTLMKPLRQIILPSRVPPQKQVSDVADFIARALGHSIHDSLEKSWITANIRIRSLKLLGYSDDVIERIVVNPDVEQLRSRNDIIPVYVEQRAFREIVVNGETFTVGGKYDMVADGIVNDFKSTTAFAWTKGTKDDEYALQGSIYQWLNPEKITEDFIKINFIFTDWSKMMLKTANYPQKRVEHKDIPLLGLSKTEDWISKKIALIQKYRNVPEDQLPECTDEELWRSDPQFKYYSDPAKANDPGSRATKNFSSLHEANAHMAEKGKGIVITKLGEAKACGYCAGFEACSQKDLYL